MVVRPQERQSTAERHRADKLAERKTQNVSSPNDDKNRIYLSGIALLSLDWLSNVWDPEKRLLTQVGAVSYLRRCSISNPLELARLMTSVAKGGDSRSCVQAGQQAGRVAVNSSLFAGHLLRTCPDVGKKIAK